MSHMIVAWLDRENRQVFSRRLKTASDLSSINQSMTIL